MSNVTGEKKLQDAFERLKKGETHILPAGSKINVSNVEQEAAMGDGSAYYYPELVKTIKEAKKQAPQHGRRSNPCVSSSLNKKNKELSEKNEELVLQSKKTLTAQAELAHQLFLSYENRNPLIEANKSTVSSLKKRKK